MRTSILSICILSISCSLASAQTGVNELQVQKSVNNEAMALAQRMKSIDGNDSISIAFSVDTFRIERTMELRLEQESNTHAMNAQMENATEAYDKLLNRYYQQLLKILQGEDKKTLITAQRAWIAFRDAELSMIGTAGKEQYSGGGTMQSNINAASYLDLVKQRTVQIFNHLDRASTATQN